MNGLMLAGLLIGEPRRLQLRHQEVDDAERDQVREPGHEEDRHVAAGALEDLADDDRDQHAADRARHAAQPDHGADGGLGEHVGDEREEVGRPALVGGGGEGDQQHRAPQAGARAAKMIGTTASAQTSMAVLRAALRAPAALDERGREPAAADAADVRDQVDDHDGQAHGAEVQAVVAVEEVGDPEEVQPPDRDRSGTCRGRRPRSADGGSASPRGSA